MVKIFTIAAGFLVGLKRGYIHVKMGSVRKCLMLCSKEQIFLMNSKSSLITHC